MILKKIVLVGSLLTITTITSNDTQSIDNTAQQEILTNKEECKEIQGHDQILCIHALSSEDQKKIIKELSASQRKDYLKFLTIESYSAFLDNYNEYDWKKLRLQLTDEEKEYWPKTIQEQRVFISTIIDTIQNGNSWYQNMSFIVDLLPYGEKARNKFEKLLFSDKTPLMQKAEKTFKKLMKKKFKL